MNNKFFHYKIIILLVVLFYAVNTSFSQTSLKNGIPQQKFDWYYVESANFTIFFDKSIDSLSTEIAEIAEEELVKVETVLDYKLQNPISILLYNNLEAELHSNLELSKNTFFRGNSTKFNLNRFAINISESKNNFKTNLRSKIASILLKEMIYGSDIQSNIQYSVVTYIPEWFVLGLQNYVAESWTLKDDIAFRNLYKKEKLRNIFRSKISENNQIAWKSLWFFIEQKYGKKAIREVSFVVRILHSMEGVVFRVFGSSLNEFTKKWEKFYEERYNKDLESFEQTAGVFTEVLLKKKYKIIDASYAFAKEKLYFVHQKSGIQQTFVYDLQSKKYKKLPIKSGFLTDYSKNNEAKVKTAVSDDENKVAVAFSKENELKIAVFNTENNTLEKEFLVPEMSEVSSLSWDQDGNKLVFVAEQALQSNIFVFNTKNETLTKITNDSYENSRAIWDFSGSGILFSSNRDTNLMTNDTVLTQKNMDIFYIFNYQNPNALQRITHTPKDNEFPQKVMNQDELLLLSDQNGTYQICEKNISSESETYHAITNTDFSTKKIQVNEQSLFVFNKSGANSQFFIQENYKNQQISSLEKSVFKQEIDHKFGKYQQKHIRIDTVEKQTIKPSKKDTTKKKVIKYYLFDESSTVSENTTKKQQKKLEKIVEKQENAEEKEEYVNYNSQKAGFFVKPDHFFWQPGYHPVSRYYLEAQAGIKDLFQNHYLKAGAKAFWDLKSSEFFINYQYLKRRVDWKLELTKNSYFFKENDIEQDINYIIRYNTYRAEIEASYPISRFQKIQFAANTNYIRRYDLNLVIEQNLIDKDSYNGFEHTLGGKFAYVFDNLKNIEFHTYKGTYVNAGFEYQYSLSGEQELFSKASLELKKYIPIVNDITFVGKFSGAMSFGNQTPVFMLGSSKDKLFSASLSNTSKVPFLDEVSHYAFSEFVGPVRGFAYNSRFGNKYAAFSAEIRIPVAKIFNPMIHSRSLYNWQFIVFTDIGTAWTDGNPLSDKNPIDPTTIKYQNLTIKLQTFKSPFIAGVGGGLRFYALGFLWGADLAWGIQDYSFLEKPQLNINFGWLY